MRVERFTYEDGRMAERRISVNDEGDEVVEIYVEPTKKLELQQIVTNKKREVLVEKKIEKVENNEVVDVEIHSSEPANLQYREHIRALPKSDSPVVIDPPIDKRIMEDIRDIITHSIADAMKPKDVKADTGYVYEEPRMKAQSYNFSSPEPVFSAQNYVEKRVVEQQEQSNNNLTYIMYGAVGIQVLVILYFMFM